MKMTPLETFRYLVGHATDSENIVMSRNEAKSLLDEIDGKPQIEEVETPTPPRSPSAMATVNDDEVI